MSQLTATPTQYMQMRGPAHGAPIDVAKRQLTPRQLEVPCLDENRLTKRVGGPGPVTSQTSGLSRGGMLGQIKMYTLLMRLGMRTWSEEPDSFVPNTLVGEVVSNPPPPSPR